jgi:hypothetical protein
MLSEDGARLLAELKTVPGGKLCVACISSRLGLDHWGVLKRLRELILSGQVMCGWYACSVCHQETAVAFPRRLYRSFSVTSHESGPRAVP